ncbi:uncharacterized protein LOC141655313 [Silene latifolia]|uniref:uncharacterized protein LOC141655313 n=1 Tax=Silene latifolia TaxID=37657 RepID=UPI003D77F803
MLETQMTQLASSSSQRQKGQLSPQGNPLTNHETVNAFQVRSGTHYEGPMKPIEEDVVEGSANSKDVVQVRVLEDRKESKTLRKNTKVIESTTTNPKHDEQPGKFMEIMKNLEVSIPLTELITHVPAYAKYMKDILTKKKSIRRSETIAFTGTSSVILQGNSPPKLNDPGSFSISCTIGDTTINKALCDLGASVSVMPYLVCEKLEMGELKCTSKTMQMADRSTKKPLGVWEDLPVRVGKFFIPVDFVILDMEEDSNIPIILERPFLHTARAVIDVKHGMLTLEVGDEKITFNLDKTMRAPNLNEPCFMVDHYSRECGKKKPKSPSKDSIKEGQGSVTKLEERS